MAKPRRASLFTISALQIGQCGTVSEELVLAADFCVWRLSRAERITRLRPRSAQPDCEWSDRGERHGRLRREVAVERSGSCRDTIGRSAGQPCLSAINSLDIRGLPSAAFNLQRVKMSILETRVI